MNLRARTAIACEIAGITPEKLNEAIKAGHIPFVPETTPGVARVFTVDGIIALTIFGFLVTRLRVNQETAGQLVEEVRWKMAGAGYEYVSIVWTLTGFWATFEKHFAEGEVIDPGGARPFTFTFCIREIKDFVIKRLEWERDNQIVGE